MPVSSFQNINPILNEVARRKPRTVIDLGVGFGKYGVLCREVLDAVNGDCRKDQWKHTIVGIEGFPQYVNPCWDVYDTIVKADFREYAEKVVGWDLVLMIDSLEHTKRDEAEIILDQLVEHNRRVIVSVPIGVCPQDGVFGNHFEEHRSTWSGDEFKKYKADILHRGICHVVSIKGNNNVT